MAKNLVIVESPAKAKTINKYLGKDYLVKASIGHIKDLPSKGLGVDVEHNFEPTYELIPDSKKRNNKRIVAELKKAAKEAEAIYLAADPDRGVRAGERGRTAKAKQSASTSRRRSFRSDPRSPRFA